MKKRIIAIALVAAMSLSMMACKEQTSDEELEAPVTKDEEAKKNNEVKEEKEVHIDVSAKTLGYDVFDYVTLGDYKGVEIKLDMENKFTDEGYDQYIKKLLGDSDIYVEDESAKEVAEDSVVNVNYVGKMDDVAFDGGSAQNVLISIASNGSVDGQSYIEGFSEGLIGHKAGETVDCPVTFPKDYGAKDLAGQEVIFTFTINYIAKGISPLEATDEQKAKQLGYSSVDEFLKTTKEDYIQQLNTEFEDAKKDKVIEAVCMNAKIDSYPEEILKERVALYLEACKAQFESYGIDYEEYISKDLSCKPEEIEKKIADQLAESYKTELVFEAVARKENISLSSEDFNEFMDDIVASSGGGSTDKQNVYDSYTIDSMSGEVYWQLQALTEKGLKFCIDNAKVVD